jgi:hypothetical protein
MSLFVPLREGDINMQHVVQIIRGKDRVTVTLNALEIVHTNGAIYTKSIQEVLTGEDAHAFMTYIDGLYDPTYGRMAQEIRRLVQENEHLIKERDLQVADLQQQLKESQKETASAMEDLNELSSLISDTITRRKR